MKSKMNLRKKTVKFEVKNQFESKILGFEHWLPEKHMTNPLIFQSRENKERKTFRIFKGKKFPRIMKCSLNRIISPKLKLFFVQV